MTMRQKKLEMSEECTLLTYSDIQECIDLVNQECDVDFEGTTRRDRALSYLLHDIKLTHNELMYDLFCLSSYRDSTADKSSCRNRRLRDYDDSFESDNRKSEYTYIFV
jgi:hypothetical protein